MPDPIASAHVKHCVLMKFQSGTPEETKSAIFELLSGLPKSALGILEMVHGSFAPSPTGKDLSVGFTDGLVVTFASIEDRNRYNTDPGHIRILQDEIVPNLENGTGGLLRFDFLEAADPA